MEPHDPHAELQRAIADAQTVEDAAWRAFTAAPPDAGNVPLLDFVRASVRRTTLNEAGLIVTLGYHPETTDGEV